MRVLWVCNTMLPAIAKSLGREAGNKEGWLTGLFEELLAHRQENGWEPGICFPVSDRKEAVQGKGDGFSYFSFVEDTVHPERDSVGLKEQFRAIYDAFRPDVIHIFGTEYAHALAALLAAGDAEKVLVGLQGLCSELAKVYTEDIPLSVQKRYTLRDFLRQDNILSQQEKLKKRGERERKLLQEAVHVTGRTAWDKKTVMGINPSLQYHFMNETLRPSFYSAGWSMESCEKNRIFLSQGDYPIKGLHYLLRALPMIVSHYPKTRVYVAGNSITRYESLKEKIKIGSYGKYLRELMQQGGLADRVVFLGKLSAEEMRQAYLDSHVFVSASVLENSPNSVGEAMLLGMPVVASRVGGVPDLLTEDKEGLLYECRDVEALAAAVCRIFAEDDLALSLGERAREHAIRIYDKEANYRRLSEIYEDLLCVKLH